MAVNLSEGAIETMSRQDSGCDNLQPLLQVIDLRLVQSQQTNITERYRVVLSDGKHYQQGMLATQKNELVKSGELTKGSVVQLTQFICNVVQSRTIIIIIELNVILSECPQIGEPVPAPKLDTTQTSTVKPGTVTENPRPVSGSSPVSSVHTRPNTDRSSVDHSVTNQPCRSADSGNAEMGRYGPNAPPSYSKIGANVSKVESSTRSYDHQNTVYQDPNSEVQRQLSKPYGRPPQPAYRQPAPIYTSRGPISKNEAPARIIPIAALNPYQNMWTIKARVTAKGELRHYNNPRADGKVFSFDLLDSDGGEIRATCFNAVADQFYNLIEAGKVYMISRGSIKPAQKNFNHLRNDQELSLDTTSVIQPCFDDDNSIPKQQFHFRSISDIEHVDNNNIVDVIGVVSAISPTSSIMRKNGTETQRRVLHLKDDSGRSIELTLWGSFCNAEGMRLQSMCDSGVYPVLAMKSGRVNDFNGKAVGTISTSQLFIEPDFPEAYKLKEWFDQVGRNSSSISLTREVSSMGRADVRKTVSQIKDEKLGTSEKPDWISVSASISFLKVDNFCYTACPIMIGDRQCNKKVTNNGDGKWRCDRCDKFVDTCDYRYILQFQIQDHTGLTWVTAFQECGDEIMGISAKNLFYLKYEEQDDEKFAEIIGKVRFTKYLLKLKIKEETFGDEQRVKSTVVKAEKVDFSTESRFLLDLIDKLKVDKAENTLHQPSMAIAGVGNAYNGQATCNPMINNSTGSREYGMSSNQVNTYGNLSNNPFPAVGASVSYLTCNNCGGIGHSSANCPATISGSGLSAGGGYTSRGSSGPGVSASSGQCFKCHQSGHWAKDCPGLSTVPLAYGSGSCGSGQRQQVGGF